MDWIKVEKNLPDKSEVEGIAKLASISRADTVCALIRVWAWADGITDTGNVMHVGRDFIDSIARHEGFAQAMSGVGWLTVSESGIRIPNFSKHLGKSAKRRAKEMDRKKVVRKTSAKRPHSMRTKSGLETETETETDKRQSKDKDIKTCSEPPLAASEPIMDVIELEFPIVGPGTRTWLLYRSKVVEYAASFPGVDLLAMFRHARQWCIDNPAKRKTAKGMPAFLSRWIANNQNRGANYGGDGRRGDLGPTSRVRGEPTTGHAWSAQVATEHGAKSGGETPVGPQAAPDRPNRLRIETGDP